MGKTLMRGGLSHLRVFLLEDDPEERALLRALLEDMGIAEVYEVADGQSGWNLISGNLAGIDMILCDWNMPGLNGEEFLKKVRAAAPAMPFLMITGRADAESIKRIRDLNVQGYIRKPFTPAQVEGRLRALATPR